MKRLLIFTLFIWLGSSIFQTKAKTTPHIRHIKNNLELGELDTLLAKTPQHKVVIVTDLHDVVFDRLTGDHSRFNNLDLKNKAHLVWNGLRFGAQYVPHKMLGWPAHPAAEAYLLPNPEDTQVLELISPFKPNMTMMNFYQNSPFPVFVCSNIGEHSYAYMKKLYEEQRTGSQKPWHQIIQGEQIATRVNGFMQKDKIETFEALVQTITKKIGYKPDVIIMVDDREKNSTKFKEAMQNTGITVIGYIFDNAKEFMKDMQPILTPQKKLAKTGEFKPLSFALATKN